MRIFHLFLFSLATVPVFSQELTVDWGELDRRKGCVQYILPTNEQEFYALRWAGGRMFGSYQLTYHKALKLQSSLRLKIQIENSIASFEGARVIGGQPAIFLSDKRDGYNHIYVRIFDDELKAVEKELKLASYAFKKGHQKGYFEILLSENNNYFAVIWEMPGKKDYEHIYGFKVFDLDFNVVNEGEYPLPFESRLSEIHQHYISNFGDYFVAISEYSSDDAKMIYKNQRTFKALHIFHINDTGLMDYPINLGDKKVYAMAMTASDSAIFTITGIYGDQAENGVAGVFYQRVDLNQDKQLSEGFEAFSKDFITLGWTDRAKKRAKRKEDKGRGEPQLYNYEMRHAVIRDDGSIVGTMEQFYIQVRSFNDARTGESNSTYYYYYNDIITYKIGLDGKFEWVKKIPKYQVSTNDGGPFSSYVSFISDDKMYFIFNDNILNYDSLGNFTDPEEIHITNYGRKRNVVALASIDLETGEKSRRTMFDRAEINALAVPKLFEVNYKTKELFIYTITGSREKLGFLRFD